MPTYTSRREFLRRLGLSSAALPFVLNLPSFGFAAEATQLRTFSIKDAELTEGLVTLIQLRVRFLIRAGSCMKVQPVAIVFN